MIKNIIVLIALGFIVYECLKYTRIKIISKKYAKQYAEEAKKYIDYDQPFKLIKVEEK
jgi:hypothetical protein